MIGKSTFKEEFVTAGGVDLKHVNFQTMEHKLVPNLYFAGEVLNIDAVTGGYNFQAAWTTAWIAAQGIPGRAPDFGPVVFGPRHEGGTSSDVSGQPLGNGAG